MDALEDLSVADEPRAPALASRATMQQINELVAKKVEEFNELKKKSDAVDVALTTLASAAQGCFIGERGRRSRTECF